MSENPTSTDLRLERLEKNGKRSEKWYVGPLTTVLIIIAGLAVQWGMMTAGTSYLENRVSKLEETVSKLTVSQARDDELIKGIKEDVTEIKKDVKTVLENRGRRR